MKVYLAIQNFVWFYFQATLIEKLETGKAGIPLGTDKKTSCIKYILFLTLEFTLSHKILVTQTELIVP